jgi:hypothetical protein
MAPPAASARDPLTAFRASRITTVAVVGSSTSPWWVRRVPRALTSFSFAGSRSATVRLVFIASVRVPRRRWGVVHIAAHLSIHQNQTQPGSEARLWLCAASSADATPDPAERRRPTATGLPGADRGFIG